MKKRNSGNGSQERCSQVLRDFQEERLGEFCQKTGTEEARTGNKTLSSKAVRAEQSAHPCSAVSSVSEAVGLKIRYYRESRGWSIRDMEAELAVAVNSPRTRSSISMWENNRRSCSIEHIPALCNLFDVTSNELIEKPNSMTASAEADTELKTVGVFSLCGRWFGKCRVVPEQLKPLMPSLAKLKSEDVTALTKLAEAMAVIEHKDREGIRTIIEELAELVKKA